MTSGTITRTWTAIDEAGNAATCVQSIAIVDTTPPEIHCNAQDIFPIDGIGGPRSRGGASSGSAGGGEIDTPVSFTAHATDGCGAAFATIVAVDCVPPSGAGSGSAGGSDCWVVIDGGTVRILDSGPVGTVISWTVEATDECGNASTFDCSIEVIGRPSGSGSGSAR